MLQHLPEAAALQGTASEAYEMTALAALKQMLEGAFGDHLKKINLAESKDVSQSDMVEALKLVLKFLGKERHVDEHMRRFARVADLGSRLYAMAMALMEFTALTSKLKEWATKVPDLDKQAPALRKWVKDPSVENLAKALAKGLAAIAAKGTESKKRRFGEEEEKSDGDSGKGGGGSSSDAGSSDESSGSGGSDSDAKDKRRRRGARRRRRTRRARRRAAPCLMAPRTRLQTRWTRRTRRTKKIRRRLLQKRRRHCTRRGQWAMSRAFKRRRRPSRRRSGAMLYAA